jgi:hypothetical protein
VAGQNKVLAFLKHEMTELLPPTIYFLIAFNVVELTTMLALRSFSVEVSNHAAATILALVVGKVVLIANKLPLLRAIDHKPLLYSVLFKSFIYSALVLIVRLLEDWLPALIHTGSLVAATEHLGTETNWWTFSLAQIWTLFFFITYVSITEVVDAFGLSGRRLYAAFVKERPTEQV